MVAVASTVRLPEVMAGMSPPSDLPVPVEAWAIPIGLTSSSRLVGVLMIDSMKLASAAWGARVSYPGSFSARTDWASAKLRGAAGRVMTAPDGTFPG